MFYRVCPSCQLSARCPLALLSHCRQLGYPCLGEPIAHRFFCCCCQYLSVDSVDVLSHRRDRLVIHVMDLALSCWSKLVWFLGFFIVWSLSMASSSTPSQTSNVGPTSPSTPLFDTLGQLAIFNEFLKWYEDCQISSCTHSLALWGTSFPGLTHSTSLALDSTLRCHRSHYW